jgi:hypothetical protein
MAKSTLYIVVADCGGGSDGNPFDSLENAQADIEGEDGVEIWALPADRYTDYTSGEVDIGDLGTLVYECW